MTTIYRNNNLEIATDSFFNLSCKLSYGQIWRRKTINIGIPFINLFLSFGRGNSWDKDHLYGFYFFEDSFVFGFGIWSKHIRLPYLAWEFESNELLDFDRNVVAIKDRNTQAINKKKKNLNDRDWYTGYNYKEAQKLKEKYSKTFDYTYVRKSGEVQEREAKVYIERRTWHRKCFPFLKQIQTTINVDFNKEVGEGTGTWKGGTLGCGYELKGNETPEQCLRRMEKDMKFNR